MYRGELVLRASRGDEPVMTIEKIEREGWFTWTVWWSLPHTGGVITGTPGYVLRRLLMWME